MASLRDHDDLREFVIKNVRQTDEDRVLGTGSYGTVEEVTINNTKYAAKKIHSVLLDTDEPGGIERIVHTFFQECQLMSSIRHPNIIQFIGICFLDGSRLPLLVMERLDTSLDDLLESTPNIPLSVKVVILADVARGLLYLHLQNPMIVHRDLTARNVLLTVSFTAKITDFGNSRLVHLQPGQLAKTLTSVPGTLVYMPPEALSDTSRSVYGTSLDVFSFGVLILFVFNQVFPGDLLSSTLPDPRNPNLILARSEFERRRTYTALLERGLVGGCEHPIFVLVRECLSNALERRPATSHLLSTLEGIRTETDDELLQLDIARVKNVRTLKAKDKRFEILQREVAAKDEQIAQKDTQLSQVYEAHYNEITTKNGIIAQNNLDLANKDRQLAQKEVALEQKERQIQKHKEEIQYKDTELAKRAAHIQQLENVHSELKPPLSLEWRRAKDMSLKMSTTVQSVVLGNEVYVGGGDAGGNRDKSRTVMVYDLQRDLWNTLTPYNAYWFAMTTLNSQLVLAGGRCLETDKPTNKVAVLEGEKWAHPYPPMNIARSSSTAVSFNNHIIVAGGTDHQRRRISSVEVLDVNSNRWCKADPLPHGRTAMKSVVVGGMCYLMGGFDHAHSRTKVVHRANLSELSAKAISSQATSNPTSLWQIVDATPLFYSTPLALKGSLLTIGGMNDGDKASSAIYLYQLGMRRWVKVGDLPTARINCTSSVLPNAVAIVAGGQDLYSYLRRVDFLTVTDSS